MSESESWRKFLTAAEGYIELGLFDEAMAQLESIPVEFRVHREIMAARINLYIASQRWEYARILAEGLVASDPKTVDWWISWAYATRRAISIEGAETILLEAEKLHSDQALIHFNLACYAAQTDRLAMAKERWERAFQIDPSIRVLALDDPDLSPLW